MCLPVSTNGKSRKLIGYYTRTLFKHKDSLSAAFLNRCIADLALYMEMSTAAHTIHVDGQGIETASSCSDVNPPLFRIHLEAQCCHDFAIVCYPASAADVAVTPRLQFAHYRVCAAADTYYVALSTALHCEPSFPIHQRTVCSPLVSAHVAHYAVSPSTSSAIHCCGGLADEKLCTCNKFHIDPEDFEFPTAPTYYYIRLTDISGTNVAPFGMRLNVHVPCHTHISLHKLTETFAHQWTEITSQPLKYKPFVVVDTLAPIQNSHFSVKEHLENMLCITVIVFLEPTDPRLKQYYIHSLAELGMVSLTTFQLTCSAEHQLMGYYLPLAAMQQTHHWKQLQLKT